MHCTESVHDHIFNNFAKLTLNNIRSSCFHAARKSETLSFSLLQKLQEKQNTRRAATRADPGRAVIFPPSGFYIIKTGIEYM